MSTHALHISDASITFVKSRKRKKTDLEKGKKKAIAKPLIINLFQVLPIFYNYFAIGSYVYL